MDSNNKLIKKLFELNAITKLYLDLSYEKFCKLRTLQSQKYDDDMEIKTCSNIVEMNRRLYYCNRNEMDAEMKKNNDKLYEICKTMTDDFTAYFLSSEDRFNVDYYVAKAKEIFKEHAELIEYSAKINDIFKEKYAGGFNASSLLMSNLNNTYPMWLKMKPLKVDVEIETNLVPFSWYGHDYHNLIDGPVIAYCFLKKKPEPPVIHRYNGCPIRLIINESLNLQLKSCIFPEDFVEEGILEIICNYFKCEPPIEFDDNSDFDE